MSAFNSGKRTTALLASGVVVGLTALTGGIAPAAAKPGDEPVTPTTVAEPEATGPATPATTVVEVPSQPPAQSEPDPTHTESATTNPPSAPEAPAAPASPVTTSAAPAESVAEPVAPAPSTTEPTTTAVPTASAPATTAATTPTVATEPSLTGAPAPTTTTTAVPATTIAPSRPAPAVAKAPGADAPAPSAAVRDAAAADIPAQRRTDPTSVPPRPGADDAAPAGVTPARSSTGDSETALPAGAAAGSIPEVQVPQTLQAPEQDVALVKSVKPLERKPDPAPQSEVAELAKVIDLAQPVGPAAGSVRAEGARVVQANAIAWDRNVRQWSPEWVRYDEYYRPVIANPYRDPVRLVYMYQNAPRVVMIPPLQSVVMEVAQLAAYSFTAVVVNSVNTAVNVAVGSFFGGGYIPAVGLPLPLPPRPVLRYDDVPIQVRYASATYEPFVVRQIVDVGEDPQYGGHKILLDGVTPVWGQWVQNPVGQRQFEVYKTQQFPGLGAPAEAPLPGDYRLRLAAESTGTGPNATNRYLAIGAATAAGLSLTLVGLSVYLGRRRPQL